MGTAYTRQSSFSDGDTITAALFNDEYNQLLTAFSYAASSTTGHQHDGTAGEGGNVHSIGDQDFLNKIVADSTNNRWGVFVQVSSSAVEQIRISDGVVSPVTDSDVDLGTSSLYFKNAYIDTITTTGAITSSSTLQGTTITATTAFVPDASDGAALGTSALEFSDLFLADGAVINFGDDQDITLTHSADAGLTTNGTFQATTITATTAFVPDASDGAALGTSALEFSDLFLADGAVINFGDDQDVSLTHVADTGLLISSTDQLQFGDSGTYIFQSADGVLDLVSDTEIEINATTIDMNGALDLSGAATIGGAITGSSTVQGTTITATTAFVPDASDGAALGTSSLEFSDLFLADGAVINFGDDQDITLTHSADTGLTTNGTFQATTITATTAFVPDASDGAALGTSSLEFSDLFLADGAVINFGDDQDVTLTHVADTGLLLSSTDRLQFGDSGTYIFQSADGVLDLVSDTEIEINATTIDINGNVDVSGTLTVAGALDFGDANITNIGSIALDTITNDGTDITLDSSSDIVLDAGGADIRLKDDGTQFGRLANSSSNLVVASSISNQDLLLQGSDGGSVITALTLDMSEAGAATFNSTITSGAGLVIADAGNIGSASDTDAIAISSAGVVALSATTEASATGTAALTLAGGIGVAKDMWIGDDIVMDSDAAVLKFGADQDVTLTHVADTGLLLNSTMALQFNDSSQYINAPSATVLDINATDEIELNATLADVNANLDVSGTYTGGGLMTTGGNIVIPDAGNIGSASDTNAIGISSGGVVSVTATTANTSATDGALTVAGGLGVALDASIGDDLRLISDAAVLSFGADSDVTFTHVADTGVLLNSTMAIQFNDASQYINAPSNAILDINATDEIELNATLADVNANLDVSGTYTGGGLMTTGGNIVIPDAGNIGSASDTDAVAISSAGVVALSATTEASATGTAALTVAGGIGVAKDMWIGDDIVMDSDAAVLKLGADQDVTLTHVADTGLLLNAAMQLQFRDSAIYVRSGADGHLDLVADSVIDIDATNLRMNFNQISSDFAAPWSTGGMICAQDAGNAGILYSHGSYRMSLMHNGFRKASSEWHSTAVNSTDEAAGIEIDGATGKVLFETEADKATGETYAITVAGYFDSSQDLWLTNDLKLDSDSSVIHFGADQDVTLTHVADTGLALKSVATGDDKPIVFTLQTGETALVADEVVGAIRFQAPDESGGTDAILVCAGVEAVAEATFTASVNKTSLVFKTGASEAAAEKARITSEGYLRLAGKGIQFNADTADANSLDDYEEGTATLTLTGTTTAPSTPITATATYVKVGKMVTIDVVFNGVNMSGSAGNIRITGLPFAAASIGVAPSMQHTVGVTGAYNIWYINSTNLDLYTIANDTGWAAEAVNSSTVYQYVSATYRV